MRLGHSAEKHKRFTGSVLVLLSFGWPPHRPGRAPLEVLFPVCDRVSPKQCPFKKGGKGVIRALGDPARNSVGGECVNSVR